MTWSGAGSVRDSQECFLVTNGNAGIVSNWPMRALENLPEQRPSHKCSEVMNNESGATLGAAPWPDQPSGPVMSFMIRSRGRL